MRMSPSHEPATVSATCCCGRCFVAGFPPTLHLLASGRLDRQSCASRLRARHVGDATGAAQHWLQSGMQRRSEAVSVVALRRDRRGCELVVGGWKKLSDRHDASTWFSARRMLGYSLNCPSSWRRCWKCSRLRRPKSGCRSVGAIACGRRWFAPRAPRPSAKATERLALMHKAATDEPDEPIRRSRANIEANGNGQAELDVMLR